jgi:arylsulfatase
VSLRPATNHSLHVKPNILFLFTDQHRFDAIRAHGNSHIRTPVLDRLIQDGTTFTRCYTPAPVCVPARAAIASGLPPHVTGCTDNAPMLREYPSFMDELRKCGYHTHGVGKMHFTPDHQKMWGFDSRDVSEETKAEGNDFQAFLRENGYDHVHEPHGIRSENYYIPQPSQLPAHLHESTWVADRSIHFLKHRNPEKPFFLWSSFIKPHPPFESPTPWNKLYRCPDMPHPFSPENSGELLTFWNRVQNRYKYKDAGTDLFLLRTMRAAYYSCISFIDFNVGRILDALGSEKDNTLIVFSSDHGELLGDYGSFGKRCMLDQAARVPFIVRWPGHAPAGTTCPTPISLLDLWPTFLEAAGSELPPAHHTSASVIDLLRTPPENRTVISQYQQGPLGLYMITDGNFKYIHSAPDRKEWLFALTEGEPEVLDLARNMQYTDTLVRLREELTRLLARDGVENTVENGLWKRHPRLSMPTDPDADLLFQDPPSARVAIETLPAAYRSTAPAVLRHGPDVLRH